MLEEREAFLRTIFDTPEDDTPRLVYADWLEEHGEEIAAKAIRLSIEMANSADAEVVGALQAEKEELRLLCRDISDELRGLMRYIPFYSVGASTMEFTLSLDSLADSVGLRESLVRQPWSFSCRSLTLTGTRLSDSQPLDVIFSLRAFQNMVELVLCGQVETIPSYVTGDSGEVIGHGGMDEYRNVSVITLSGVEALANHRGCRRLVHLDLRNNNLGNDALRFLAKSPYLDNLKRLDIAEGNSFRGRVWQLLIERFGEDAVS